MKTLTIRLDKHDLENISGIERHCGTATINGVIRYALKQAIEYKELKGHLADLFVSVYQVDQKKLKEINTRFGLLQGRFDW